MPARLLAVAASALAVLLVTATGAGAAQGDPRRAITAADQAKARSVVLRRADLGSGFRSRPASPGDVPSAARCQALSEADLTITGDATSPDFSLTQQGALLTVASTAQVYRTVREANASWSRSLGRAAVTCFADIVRLSAGTGQRIQVLAARRVAFPPVAAKTMAFRIVAQVRSGAASVKLYVDAVVLQQGRVQAGLIFTSALQPVAQTDRATLASVVAARIARAATGSSGPTA